MLYIDTAESEAQQIRERLGIAEQKWIDIPTVLTKAKKLIPGFNYRLASDEVPKGKLAYWDSEKLEIVLKADTFQGANFWAENPRARFSILHECVHALRGDQGRHFRAASQSDIPKYATKLKKLERHVERVTAAILMPFKFLADYSDASEIARAFGVSRQAATIRFEEYQRATMTRQRREIPARVREILEELRRRKPE